jgi:xanthine/CO dehydrogenase XdhC/CoxF family maturation factor
MKHWLETREVLDRLAAVRSAGMRAALCTVIRVRGSVYRREGAKLLVADDGTTTGNVSGGCLEQDVREVALQVIQSGRAEVRRYCSSDDITSWDLGLGCDGEVEVLIEPAPEPRPRERALLEERIPFAIVRVLPTGPRGLVTAESIEGTLDAEAVVRARDLLLTGRSAVEDVNGCSIFIESLIPPPQLVVFGAGDDARPLAQLAADAGFRVVVTDKRPAYLTVERFPAAADLVGQCLALDETEYAVVMTHNFAHDQEFVRLLLASPVPYIGILGPRQRTERILGNLAREGAFDESQRDRIYGPVGLDIGTDGAEQVALSIVAELLAVRSGRRVRSVRERPVPIHAGDD